jgi:ketosteroid isomerase-like protein
MRNRHNSLALAAGCLICILALLPERALAQSTALEVPLHYCDRLPSVIVKIDKVDMHFLLDTGATSMLNTKSFAGGRSQTIGVTSWSGTQTTSARDILIGDLTFGNYHLRHVRLPAIDLSGVAARCGGPIDGIMGVDLLEAFGVTIDLRRRVARPTGSLANSSDFSFIADLNAALNLCVEAFNNADANKLAACFDPDLVVSSPDGEYRGRDRVLDYLRYRYFRTAGHARVTILITDQRVLSDVVWVSYDYTLDSVAFHAIGRGVMLCRKSGNRWEILDMHLSLRNFIPAGSLTDFSEYCP